MNDPAGKLHIQLDAQGVTIDSTRPTRAAQVFVGRGVAETARLLPALFSICATAQAAACASACEQALGTPAASGIAALRLHLVETETLREHLWRILLDWPRALGEEQDAPAMARALELTEALRRALDAAGGTCCAPGAPAPQSDHQAARRVRHDLRALARERVFGRQPAVWLHRVDGLDTLKTWAEATDTVAARLLRQVIDAGQAGIGRSPVPALPPLPAAELEGRLASEDTAADAFITHPVWGGTPRESSPFTRQSDTPLVHHLTGRFGNGLLPRLAAQLTEVARLLTVGGAALGEPEATPAPLPAGVGIAQVQAARGLLVHRVRIAGGRIAAYRILAPTEWNFHPRGAAALGLADLLGSADPDAVASLASIYCAALDPCVGFELQLPGSATS